MKVRILYIGRNKEIMQTVLRLLNKSSRWKAEGASGDEEAIELFHRHKFDIILLGPGIEKESENKLRALFKYHNPDIVIIQHYGGGSGLLNNEILLALSGYGKN
jgi:DNA-binding NtrC family response regulator